MSTVDVEFLDLAESISEWADSEAHRRASINRSYYAAYHRASAYHASLKTPGRQPDHGGVHEKLIGQLNNPTVQHPKAIVRSKEIGQMLHSLKRARFKADYKLQEKVTRGDVIGTMMGAKKLLEMA